MRELAASALFVQQVDMGYRFARFNPDFYKGLKPGEVRAMRFAFVTRWRPPIAPNHGQHEARASLHIEMSQFADISGTFHHSLLNRFNWDGLKGLLGTGPVG